MNPCVNPQVVADLPGATVMRLLRCFRVFRLFKRIKSLKKIVLALTKSVVPMFNAFIIVCLVTAIYSIIATTFYGEAVPENFSSFFVSFYTLFEVLCSLLLLLLAALFCISSLSSLLSSHCSLLSGLDFLLCALCSLLPSPCPRQHHSHTRKCFNLY